MIDVVNCFEINSDCEVNRVVDIIIVIVTILNMPKIVSDLCVPAGKQIHQQLPKLLRVISTVHPLPWALSLYVRQHIPSAADAECSRARFANPIKSDACTINWMCQYAKFRAIQRNLLDTRTATEFCISIFPVWLMNDRNVVGCRKPQLNREWLLSRFGLGINTYWLF